MFQDILFKTDQAFLVQWQTGSVSDGVKINRISIFFSE